MSLQVQQLVKHFDGVKAVNGVSFDVRAGECVALIGPNGAGKSTCFACIAGQHALTSGQILWNGRRLDNLNVQARLHAGVARTFQVAQTFEALTVLQNVQLTLGGGKGLSAWQSIDRRLAEPSRALLDKLDLLPMAHADVLGLPYGAKKRLELAIALAGMQGRGPAPQLLLLDEPAAGLAGPERAQLMQLVKSLAEGAPSTGGGIAVLYTEHNMDAVFGVADRVLVLIDGHLAAQGTPNEVAQDATVRERYLGKGFRA